MTSSTGLLKSRTETRHRFVPGQSLAALEKGARRIVMSKKAKTTFVDFQFKNFGLESYMTPSQVRKRTSIWWGIGVLLVSLLLAAFLGWEQVWQAKTMIPIVGSVLLLTFSREIWNKWVTTKHICAYWDHVEGATKIFEKRGWELLGDIQDDHDKIEALKYKLKDAASFLGELFEDGKITRDETGSWSLSNDSAELTCHFLEYLSDKEQVDFYTGRWVSAQKLEQLGNVEFLENHITGLKAELSLTGKTREELLDRIAELAKLAMESRGEDRSSKLTNVLVNIRRLALVSIAKIGGPTSKQWHQLDFIGATEGVKLPERDDE